MSLNVLFDKVMVRRDETKTTTESGLVIPESAQGKQQTATVIKIGRDVPAMLGYGENLVDPPLVGKKIFMHRHAGTDVKHENETFVILPVKEILAVLG